MKKKKIGVLIICTGYKYWPYVGAMIESARKYFLTDHDVQFFLWTDMPDVTYGAKIYDTDATEWPLPTLMRYHLFLQQEKDLIGLDYLFYIDADMLFLDKVGKEVLGDGLTAVEHPMYSFRPGLQFPLEPNPESTAYIHVPKHYFAGGFQGGKAQDFIKAMWSMKRCIDQDFNNNYMARWNDESHWNRYLFDNPPVIVLDPSYCYPNSMVEKYYEPIWGRKFVPKLTTIDKKFTMTKEAGKEMTQMIADLDKLK